MTTTTTTITRRGRLLLAATGAACALAALPAGALPTDAHALTMREASGSGDLLLREDSGVNESNTVRILDAGGGRITVHDSQPLKVATSKCRVVTATSAECGTFPRALVELGDRDDTFLTTTSMAIRLLGGPDEDTYYGGNAEGVVSHVEYHGDAGSDRVDYGAAKTAVSVVKGDGLDFDGRSRFDRDQIRDDVETVSGTRFDDFMVGASGTYDEFWDPRAGNDTVHGGDGNDYLQAGVFADGADTFRAGAGGFDTANYDKRTARVVLKPDAGGPDDGAAGEGDELIDVEILGGGSGDDLLRASATTSYAYLFGGPGSDSLIGSAKSDYLVGGPNSDAYFADAGDDVVIANNGAPDHVDCGAGQDTASLDATEQGVFGCEVR